MAGGGIAASATTSIYSRTCHRARTGTGQGRLQVGLGQPEVALGLDGAAMRQLGVNAFEASWLASDAKARWIAEIDALFA